MSQIMVEITPAETAKRKFTNPLDPLIRHFAHRMGGSKAKELERFLKFALVGFSGAVIDLTILATLQATILPPVDSQNQPNDFNVALATTCAFITAVISNFIWTRLWVYPDSRTRSVRRQLTQFAIVSVIGWVARTIWVTSMYVSFGNSLTPQLLPLIHQFQADFVATPDAVKRIGSVAAQLVAMVFVMMWNFFANRYWTYNDVD